MKTQTVTMIFKKINKKMKVKFALVRSRELSKRKIKNIAKG
jgi:hypothetical protein